MGSIAATEEPGSPSKYLCLTILGYRKPGMSEEAYRHHMTKVSAPMTKDLMTKYGVKRWTMASPYSPLRPFGNHVTARGSLYSVLLQCRD